ncbi:hypothetical protein ATCC90586_011988 [Pythium insidiosum]|nr:hypothetical protein ATCC90586_011988 [Pythium insidiosum]
MDAAMATSDSSSNNNTSSSNGHKRRLDATPPADDDSRSKRSRVSDAGVIDVDLTQPTQQPQEQQQQQQQQQQPPPPVQTAPVVYEGDHESDEEATVALANAELARSFIESALNGDAMSDQLVQRALEALDVVASPHVANAVLVAVDALAVALHQVDEVELAATRDDRVTAMMDRGGARRDRAARRKRVC